MPSIKLWQSSKLNRKKRKKNEQKVVKMKYPVSTEDHIIYNLAPLTAVFKGLCNNLFIYGQTLKS